MRFRFSPHVAARVVISAMSLLGSAGFATPTTSIQLEPHWRVGDHLDYQLKKTGVGSVGGVVKVNTWNTTPIHVEVAAVETDGFLLSWTFGETRFDDVASASMTPSMKRMAGVMAGRKLTLRVDRHGRLVEIVNWQVVRNAANTLAEEFAASLARSGVSGAQAASATEQFRAKFATEEGVRALSMREAQLLFLTLGHRYDSTHPTEYMAVVSNPIGAGVIAVKEHVQSKFDGKDISLEWSQRSTQGASRAEEPTVRGRASIEVQTGWPASVVQTTSAVAGDVERTETISLQRQ